MQRRIGAIVALICLVLCASVVWAGGDSAQVAVKGYVLDSACAFTKSLAKPISKECANQCASAGSPLVILGDDGTIYWPIAGTTPASGQNSKLVAFAGAKVTVHGKVYERGGSHAIVIDRIDAEPPHK